MPGWHKATSELRTKGLLATAGVVLEQHPDRARLFMQWHEMDWPVLWDPFNLLELPAVPISCLLDPDGVVLAVQPSLEKIDDLAERLGDQPASPGSAAVFVPRVGPPPVEDAPAEAWSDHAVSLALWAGDDRLDEAVEAAARNGRNPVQWFRLGVVYRMRYDSAHRRPGDFTAAVNSWARALDADPNQYIWRRRLQQYGPRLAKPYPFYDWVPTARAEIGSRGETPVPLRVEPHGAEFATPAKVIAEDETTGQEPDPRARVHRDVDGLIRLESVVIPPVAVPGEGVRIHLVLIPNDVFDAHWNNEAGHCELWVDTPGGWRVDQPHQLLPVGPGEVSDETRHVEFEAQVPEDGGDQSISGYLLYYVCEGAAGVCVYRRHDFEIEVKVKPAEGVGLAG